MADNLFDEYGEINPNLPRPRFSAAVRTNTGYRYIRKCDFPGPGQYGYVFKYKVYVPPPVRWRREIYLGTFDTLEEAVEAQRQAVIDQGVNVEYILAHMRLPDPETC